MNVFDQASDRELDDREKLIALAREGAAAPIPTSEHCLFCEEPTTEGRRFCDRECADDWERRQRMARGGRP